MRNWCRNPESSTRWPPLDLLTLNHQAPRSEPWGAYRSINYLADVHAIPIGEHMLAASIANRLLEGNLSYSGPVSGARDSSIKPKEKPDRYAAAICIMVRPDWLLRGYSVGESCGLSVVQRV